MKSSDFYNFIIVGAGTAGLTAAIIAARKGYSVVILEKGAIAGPKPRGECMVLESPPSSYVKLGIILQ